MIFRFFLLLGTILILNPCDAQSYLVAKKDVPIGENQLTQEIFVGDLYRFVRPILKMHIDSVENAIAFILRAKTKNKKYYKPAGNLIYLQKNRIKWQEELNFNLNNVILMNSMIIKVKPKKSFSLNLENGRENWEIPSLILLSSRKHKMALGYFTKGLKNRRATLQGINLDNGKLKWQAEVDRTYGWRSIKALSDSIFVIAAQGIHAIDLNKGKLWSHEVNTGKVNLNFWTTTNTLYNMGSNLVVDSTSIYYATLSNIFRFDYNGNQIWNSKINPKHTSKSFLQFLPTDKLLFINTGYVNSVNKFYKKYGSPYFQINERLSGKQLVNVALDSEKIDFIISYKMKETTLYIANKNYIQAFDSNTGQLLGEADLSYLDSPITDFTNNKIYVAENDQNVQRIDTMFQDLVFVILKDKRIIGLDQSFNVSRLLDLEKNIFFLKYTSPKGLKFLTNTKKTYIVDSSEKVIGITDMADSYFAMDGKIYAIKENELKVMDIAKMEEMMLGLE